MAENRLQSQFVNILRVGDIELPEVNTDSRDVYTTEYSEAGFQHYLTTMETILMLHGRISVEGNVIEEVPCGAPQYWTDSETFHLPYQFPNEPDGSPQQCDDYCRSQSCIAAGGLDDIYYQGFPGNPSDYCYWNQNQDEHPFIDYYYSYDDICNCYGASRNPYLQCNITAYPNSNATLMPNDGYLNYPNQTMSSPFEGGAGIASGIGDAIGVFYDGTLLGWEYINTGVVRGAPQFNNDNDYYPNHPFSGVSNIFLCVDIGISETSHCPQPGTILTPNNTEIILYRGIPQTFHRLNDESLNAMFENIPSDLVLNTQDIYVAVGNIGNNDYTWEYDNEGRKKKILDYGTNILQYDFSAAINQETILPPRPLPQQETIADCRTTEDCRNGFICRAGKCVPSTSAPIGRLTQDRQLQDVNTRGGASIPGCTNPNALNFNPLATGCPVDNPACCLFEEPLVWECDAGSLDLCYGAAQSVNQHFVPICANRNDCYAGCGAEEVNAPGPNEDFTNYCDYETFGYLWNNQPCCTNDPYPINAEYWDINGDMNFPTLEQGYNNISWEPHDSLFFINCGNDGTDCINDDPQWLFGPEAHKKIYSHMYIPAEGYEFAQQVMIGGNYYDVVYLTGIGFWLSLMARDNFEYTQEYPTPGNRIDIMIYKRSRGLLYRTDNFNNGQGNMVISKAINSDLEFLNWPDEFVILPQGGFYEIDLGAKLFPTGGVQIVGCMDVEAYNYNPQASIQEPNQCNYDFPKYGCINPACENYDLDADIDDGSCFGCEYDEGPIPDFQDMPVGGCMNPDAINYNPNATFDNGTCEYEVDYTLCGSFQTSEEADEYCQRTFSPTYRCSTNHLNQRVCIDFAGDVSGDGILNFEDICMLASHLLQRPIEAQICGGVVGSVSSSTNLTGVFQDPVTSEMFQFGDLNQDGVISVMEFIEITNHFIYERFATTESIEQALQDVINLFDLTQTVLREYDDSTSTPTPRPRPIRRPRVQTIDVRPISDTMPLPEFLKYVLTINLSYYYFDVQKIARENRLNINDNLYMVAECNGVVVGNRQLNKNSTIVDVPVSGVDKGITDTREYCQIGQSPIFYIYDVQNDRKQELPLFNIPAFSGNYFNHAVNY